MTTQGTLTEEFVEGFGSSLLLSLDVPNQRGRQIDEAGERARLTVCVLAGRLANAIQRFHDLLVNGVPVEYKDAKTGEMRGGRARLIDFDHPTNDDFLVVRQLTVAGANGKAIRPDLLLFVNGLPLVVIELKDPANAAANLEAAIDQLGRCKTAAPDLFIPNVLLVASDGLLTRAGSITSGRQRFTPWRPAEGGEPTLEALIRELLNPAALLDYLRSCVAFQEDERGKHC